MKTFRRYLTSYLLTLFLPIGILSIVISQIVLHYCANQLLDSNAAALRQLDITVSMQVTQFNAYALQTTQRSEFTSSKLERTGTFYDVQRTLLQWQMTNTLMNDVYFFNTGTNMVYAHNMVNPTEKVYQYRFKNAGFERDTVMQLLSGEARSPWLSAQSGGQHTLLYSAYARMNTQTQNVLLFSIDTNALHELMRSTALYDSTASYLCDSFGTILYASVPYDTGINEQVQQLISLPNDCGIAHLDNGNVLYTRLFAPQHGLIFLNMVPEKDAYAPLSRLWSMFFAGLMIIFALGGTVVAFVMRVNYLPIRNLEKDVIASEVLSDPTNDAVLNVRKALQTMQQNSSLIVRRSIALSKERLILRLLLGGYTSAEEFNAEGEGLSLRLMGECWRIMIIRGIGTGCEEENFALRLEQNVRERIGTGQMQLYLEIPEHHMIIFIMDGRFNSTAEEITQALQVQGMDVQVIISPCCHSTTKLSRAWAQIIQPIRDETSTTEMPAPVFYGALRNALQFGEVERIRFALETLRSSLSTNLNRATAMLLCNDLLYLVRWWMEGQEDDDGIQALRVLTQEVIESPDPPNEVCSRLLTQITQLLIPRVLPREQDESSLIQSIEAYLSQNYRDANFTVQQAADHFQLSISNLSHYFKNHVGVSVSEYVEQLRMQAAQELLTQTRYSVARIAAEVGYAQPATFMRAFKKVSGVSPTVYRNKTQDTQ